MSDSHKARNGRLCKRSKDSGWNSRSQKQAWAKTKQRRSQAERTRAKAAVRKEAT